MEGSTYPPREASLHHSRGYPFGGNPRCQVRGVHMEHCCQLPRPRFRQVPTFGNGVIHKFSNNTSEMKRLAARNFEDILQVSLFYVVLRGAEASPSAPFQFLKGCSPQIMTWRCGLCYIDSRNGTHSQSLGSTQILPSFFLKIHSRNSPRSCGGFVTTLALPLLLQSC